MKLKTIVSILLLYPLFTACIQDEPLNPEADILEFNLPEGMAVSAPLFNQNNIMVMVNKTADITKVKPQIKITEGATILPDTNMAQDFTNPVKYTVTSQNKLNERIYTVQLISSSLYKYSFNRWEENTKTHYETPIEYGVDGVPQRPWASSNVGVAIYQQYPSPQDYPVRSTTTAFEGQFAAEMRTQKGPGNILGIQYIPIVAGSLFLGSLNPLNALNDPLTATQFGLPFYDKPLVLKGQYKYKRGTGEYIGSDGKPIPNTKDFCAIYAVLYQVDKETDVLDGTNILTSKKTRARAMLADKDDTPGDTFKPFELEFDYASFSSEPLDFTKNKYKLAIVFSSSFYGDHYEGALGSTLVVDNVEVVIEEKE